MRWLRMIVALSVFGSAAAAHGAPNSWAEGDAATDDGATRDFYNRAAVLPWSQLGGDWLDRDGSLHGNAAWAATSVEDTDTARYIEWDVTALVQAWADGSVDDHGVFLRPTSGGGPIVFASREHGVEAERPELIVTVGGASMSPATVADTYLEPSTYQAQGSEPTLRVSGDAPALVRFDTESLAGETIETATLRLFTTEQFGTAELGVFAPAPGRQGPPPDREGGFATEVLDDEGLADHPDVILFEDFSAPDWMEHWTDHGGTFSIIDAAGEAGFEPLAGQALRSTIPQGENTGLNTGFNFMDKLGEEPEEIYFRYYMRLGNTWNQSVDGGKLPGVSGTYGVAGWGGRQSDGTNGWSARGLFRTSVPDSGNPLAGSTAVGSYVYHADMPGTYGDNFLWVENWGAEGYGGVLETDRWYCLEHYVRMNTLGENDGVLRGWVDGRLSLDRTDLRFRDVDTLKIERIWMNVYHGGTDVSPYDQDVFIDNVVIARSYVGPMGQVDEPGETDGPDSDTGNGGDEDDSAGEDTSAGDSADDGAGPGGDPTGATSGAASDASSDDPAASGCGCAVRTSPTTFGPAAMLVLLVGCRRRMLGPKCEHRSRSR